MVMSCLNIIFAHILVYLCLRVSFGLLSMPGWSISD